MHQHESWFKSAGRNVAVLAAFWLGTLALLRLIPAAMESPRAGEIALLLGCASGLVLALRFRAFIAALLLAGQVAVHSSIFAVNTYYGIPAIAGQHVAWALIIAGTLGTILGALLMRRFANAPPPVTNQLSESSSGAKRAVEEAPPHLLRGVA